MTPYVTDGPLMFADERAYKREVFRPALEDYYAQKKEGQDPPDFEKLLRDRARRAHAGH